MGGRKDAGGSKSKRTRSETIVVPKPNRSGIGGGQVRGRDSGDGSGPTIMDESTGKVMDRGGEEAIKKMEQETKDQLVETLSERMNELFANLAVKQEEENTRLREENQQMKRQMEEQKNKMDQQSNRMEQMMGMLMQRLGMELPDSPPGCQPALVTPVVTPVKGSKGSCVMPPLPGVDGPSSLEKTGRPVTHPQFGMSAEQVAEVMKSNLAMKEALRDCMAEGTGLTQFMQSRGHQGVVGMIQSGGVSLPEGR